MVNSMTGAPMRLLGAFAWPAQDYVLISAAGDTGSRQLHVDVDDARNDREIIAQLHSVSPERRRAPAPRQDARGVVVGSKNSPEQLILGELYAQALRARGFGVRLRGNLGATQVLRKALDDGHIGMYPEYTGVICAQLAQLDGRPRRAREAYEAAREWEDSRGNALSDPSASHTRGCVVVRTAFALEHALTTIGDLRKLEHFTYGGPAPLATRYQGADGLRRGYELHNFTFVPMRTDLLYTKLGSSVSSRSRQ